MSLFPFFCPFPSQERENFSLFRFFRRNTWRRRCESHWCPGMFSSVKLNKHKKRCLKKGKEYGHEWSKLKWVKRMKKVKRKLKVIYCIECAALKCTFQRGTEPSHFSISFSSFLRRCKRDEHVDAHFLKRFNSIKNASIMFIYIFYAHTFSVMYVQLVTWENFFVVWRNFLLRSEDGGVKKFYFVSILTRNFFKYHRYPLIKAEQLRETKVRSWCENNQSKCLGLSYIHQVLCQQHQVHWKFMSFLIIITLWCSLCGDKLRYDWNLSFLSNLRKEIKNRNQTKKFVKFFFVSFFFVPFLCEYKKKLKLNNSSETIEWFFFWLWCAFSFLSSRYADAFMSRNAQQFELIEFIILK